MVFGVRGTRSTDGVALRLRGEGSLGAGLLLTRLAARITTELANSDRQSSSPSMLPEMLARD